jgi:hypothetical protein
VDVSSSPSRKCSYAEPARAPAKQIVGPTVQTNAAANTKGPVRLHQLHDQPRNGSKLPWDGDHIAGWAHRPLILGRARARRTANTARRDPSQSSKDYLGWPRSGNLDVRPGIWILRRKGYRILPVGRRLRHITKFPAVLASFWRALRCNVPMRLCSPSGFSRAHQYTAAAHFRVETTSMAETDVQSAPGARLLVARGWAIGVNAQSAK